MKLAARLAATCGVSLAAHACAQDVAVTGSNTVAIERADSWGESADASHAPRRGYDDLNVSFAWRATRWDQWSLDLAGRASDLSSDRGASLSTFTLRRENGEGRIPYRVEAGDFSGMVTTNTSTRTLKGLYLEIQPRSDALAITHSLVAFAGKVESPWHDAGRGTNESAGLSWLAQSERANGPSAGLHWVRNVLAADADAGTPRRAQDIASVTASGRFVLLRGRWDWAGEIAGLRGDATSAESLEDRRRNDRAAYGRVSAVFPGAGLRWSALGESTGRDFEIIDGTPASDRRNLESALRWDGPAGVWAKLSWRRTRDGVETPRARDDRLVKAVFKQPLPFAGAVLEAEGFHETFRRADASEDRITDVLKPALRAPLGQGELKMTLVMQNDRNELLPGQTQRKREMVASWGSDFRWGEWQGHVMPNVRLLRLRKAGGLARERSAGVALDLRNGAHQFSLTTSGLAQRPVPGANPEVTSSDSSASYTFTHGRHRLAFTYSGNERHPTPGAWTAGRTLGVQWTVDLDNAAQAAAPAPRGGMMAAPAPAASVTLPRNAGVVFAIPMGAAREQVLSDLARAAFGEGVRRMGAQVYDTELLPDVRGQQQLAVIFNEAGAVDRVAVFIALDEYTSAPEVARAYDRTLREMIERLGRPQRIHAEGAFGANFLGDVKLGRLVRYAEWVTPDGVVRVGIPARLDGVARIEIQRGRRLDGPRERGWGLEYLR